MYQDPIADPNIEEKAVIEVERLLSDVRILKPDIRKGEKGVSWDGYVEVYKSPNGRHADSDYRNKIALQVKGKQRISLEESITYPVRVADIHNYSTDAPTLYLVVRIGTDGKDRKVYYHVFHKEDYESLQFRSDGQQTKNCRFWTFPTEPDEVEKLILGLVEVKEGRQLPVLDLPLEEPETNLFLYKAEAVGFVGRDDEMKELRAFLDAPSSFLWWGIAAPGGAGKSRLAYEFCKGINPDEHGWQTHLLRLADYQDLNGLVAQYGVPLLLVADYAQYHLGTLAQFMAEQHDRDASSPQLRLLLLERDGGEEDGVYPWERWLLESTHGSYIRQDQYKAVRHLGPLPDKDIAQLIRSYANALGEKESIPVSLSDRKVKELVARLREMDSDGMRALYAMLLADAAVHEPQREDLSLQDLLDIPRDRDEKSLKQKVANLIPETRDREPDPALLDSCQHVQRVATALGTSGDPTFESVEELCTDALKALERRGRDPREALQEVGLVSLDHGDGFVVAIRPDILGEYVILRFLKDCRWKDESKKRAFFAAVLQETELLTPFYEHLFRDFRKYPLGEKSLFEILLPKKLSLNNSQKSSYVELIAEAFDWTLVLEERLLLVDTMRAIVADGIEGEVERCKAFNSLGYIHNQMGQYGEALDCFEQALRAVGMTLDLRYLDRGALGNLALALDAVGAALNLEYLDAMMGRGCFESADYASKCYSNAGASHGELGNYDEALTYHVCALFIRKRAFGETDFRVATSYHNIGYVCNKMASYELAIDYHKRALDIREAKLGNEHFAVTTSCNNIGVAYGNMGRFDEALDYLERARAIREHIHGPGHPSVATCLDHIGNVLAEKGGDLDEALAMLEEALSIREKTIGSSHPQIAMSCQNIGDVHFKREEYREALAFYERGLSIAKQAFGPEHRTTVLLREGVKRAREM